MYLDSAAFVRVGGLGSRMGFQGDKVFVTLEFKGKASEAVEQPEVKNTKTRLRAYLNLCEPCAYSFRCR